MNRISLLALATAALFLSGVAGQGFVMAQEAPKTQPVLRRADINTVRVKNVRASLMAWWLDPNNNEEPVEFRQSRINAEGIFPQKLSQNDGAKPLGARKLPEGVERIIAIDPQNAILVFGTDAGFTEFQKTVTSLDKPLRQVEIEVRYIEINDADMKQLGIEAEPKNTDAGPWTQSKVTQGTLAQIDTLLAQQKARIITAPRVTAINNLTANLRSTTVTHTTLGIENDGKRLEVPNSTLQGEGAFLQVGVGIGIGITVTPTIHDDDTISLLLAPGRVLQMEVPEGETKQRQEFSPWNRNIDGVQTISHIKNGETVALLGSDTRLFEQFSSLDKKRSKILILVKPQLVRRLG